MYSYQKMMRRKNKNAERTNYTIFKYHKGTETPFCKWLWRFDHYNTEYFSGTSRFAGNRK